jgi:hypothetical protein
MVVVKVGFGSFRRSQVYKYRLDPFRLNLGAKFGHIVQGLTAEGTTKMAKKNQQQRGLIDQLEQGPAAFRTVLLEHGGHPSLPRNCF